MIENNSKLDCPDPSIEKKLINFGDAWEKVKQTFGEKIHSFKMTEDFDQINHHISSVISQVTRLRNYRYQRADVVAFGPRALDYSISTGVDAFK